MLSRSEYKDGQLIHKQWSPSLLGALMASEMFQELALGENHLSAIPVWM